MSSKIYFGVALSILMFVGSLKAQNDSNDTSYPSQNYGFNKHKLFSGGSLNLGFGGGTVSSFAVGVLPEIGYSFKEWLDLGLACNLTYYSGSEDTYDGIPGYKAVTYGAGIFARLHPFEGYFIQLQPEVDNYSIKETLNGQSGKLFRTYTSYLAGIGWGRRVIGEMSFYTVIMVDLGNERNTPYKDSYGNLLPVVRAGINFYF